jgi:hypothetical protein
VLVADIVNPGSREHGREARRPALFEMGDHSESARIREERLAQAREVGDCLGGGTSGLNHDLEIAEPSQPRRNDSVSVRKSDGAREDWYAAEVTNLPVGARYALG